MHKAISILLASGLLLVCTGCGLLEREYVQISQHQEQTAETCCSPTAKSAAQAYAGSILTKTVSRVWTCPLRTTLTRRLHR